MPIHVLDPDCIRKISAGEIIEGPVSIVRELIDNSIDARASSIDIHIEQGGIEKIRITDNGSGMSKEDLELCWKEHATSKIQHIDDLKQLHTRGFRGEALAAISAVSRMSIYSRKEASTYALMVENNKQISLEASTHAQGTTIQIENLFHNLPARKRFLKHAQGETNRVRAMVLEKAMSIPETAVRFYTDNKLRKHFPPTDLKTRVSDILDVSKTIVHSVQETGQFYTINAVLASPERNSSNRSKIRIYVNNYYVRDFQLLQAVEYAYRDVLPGGVYPIAAVFIAVDPEMLDVNIHPAKREVRIRKIDEIRHSLIQTIRSVHFAQDEQNLLDTQELLPTAQPSSEDTVQEGTTTPRSYQRGDYSTPPSTLYLSQGAKPYGQPYGQRIQSPQQLWAEQQLRSATEQEFYYLGQVYDTFLIIVHAGVLYMVDQHASHERMLYDRLQEDMPSQVLLMPIEFDCTEDESQMVQSHIAEYQAIGIQIQQSSEQNFVITEVPEAFLPLIDELPECIRELRGLHGAFAKEFLASIACKHAVKAKDIISPAYIQEMLRYIFALEKPRCPHGRPLWIKIDEGELLKRIGRVV